MTLNNSAVFFTNTLRHKDSFLMRLSFMLSDDICFISKSKEDIKTIHLFMEENKVLLKHTTVVICEVYDIKDIIPTISKSTSDLTVWFDADTKRIEDVYKLDKKIISIYNTYDYDSVVQSIKNAKYHIKKKIHTYNCTKYSINGDIDISCNNTREHYSYKGLYRKFTINETIYRI